MEVVLVIFLLLSNAFQAHFKIDTFLQQFPAKLRGNQIKGFRGESKKDFVNFANYLYIDLSKATDIYE
jgi:hypothetical protein